MDRYLVTGVSSDRHREALVVGLALLAVGGSKHRPKKQGMARHGMVTAKPRHREVPVERRLA